MTPRLLQEWPHATAQNLTDLSGPEHIEVFDDEPGYVALYIADDHGHRYPVRTVATANPAHLNSVLMSWATDRPLCDRRQVQEPPLPTN